MGLDVLIKVNSEMRYANGQKETITQSYVGQLFDKENHYYLRYREKSELGDVWTNIKWSTYSPNNITIIRQGSIKATQIFKEGYSHNSLYQNQFVSFSLSTNTTKLEIDHRGNSGYIYVDYEISNEEQLLGYYSTKIEYNLK